MPCLTCRKTFEIRTPSFSPKSKAKVKANRSPKTTQIKQALAPVPPAPFRPPLTMPLRHKTPSLRAPLRLSAAVRVQNPRKRLFLESERTGLKTKPPNNNQIIKYEPFFAKLFGVYTFFVVYLFFFGRAGANHAKRPQNSKIKGEKLFFFKTQFLIQNIMYNLICWHSPVSG